MDLVYSVADHFEMTCVSLDEDKDENAEFSFCVYDVFVWCYSLKYW